ncbi:hypothetical protein WJX77_002644 [Trebouxia sp. C0004]
MRTTALQALQEEAAAGHTHTFTSGNVSEDDAADDGQWETDMAGAEGADPGIADAGDPDFGTDFGSPAQQDSQSEQQQPQPATWVPPRAPEVSEHLGLNGFFADVEQQVRPPKEELDKRLPGRDGSLLVKGSPLTIAKALEAGKSVEEIQSTAMESSHLADSVQAWTVRQVPGYDDRDSRNPEPMHNTGNEVSAVTVMAMGGTAAIYSVARLKEVTDWETDHNSDGRSSRWLRQLRPYSTGCKDIPNLDWTATPQALSTAKQRCEDMRIYDDVVFVPPGIRTVEFEKVLGSAGKVKTWEYLLMAGPYGKYLLEDNRLLSS